MDAPVGITVLPAQLTGPLIRQRAVDIYRRDCHAGLGIAELRDTAAWLKARTKGVVGQVEWGQRGAVVPINHDPANDMRQSHRQKSISAR